MMQYELHVIHLPTIKPLQKGKKICSLCGAYKTAVLTVNRVAKPCVYFWKIYTGMVSEPICLSPCLTSSLQDHS